MCFRVFNIRFAKYNEKPKYSTKNNISEGAEVFLDTKNHTSERISSSRNFRLTATIRCIVREAGSLKRPRRKIINESRAIEAKLNNNIRRSAGCRLIFVRERSNPMISRRKVKRRNLIIMPDLEVTFGRYHLIKSLIAV